MTLAQPIIDVKKATGLSYAEIGRALGLERAVVHAWFRAGRRIPAERVRDLAHVTGIPPHKLRPDLFGPKDAA